MHQGTDTTDSPSDSGALEADGDPAIIIRQLTKSYGQVTALDGIDLCVGRGEIFGFLGPNGSGKTTTIRCLLDLIRPTSGYLRVLGLNPQRAAVQVRRRVGYLPGELNLDDNLSATATFRLFDAFRGGGTDWPFVRRLQERLDLDPHRKIKNFSKGNKQKVGVIQAFMHRPELLLLDEPTSGLDPLMQREVLQLVGEARAAGTTVFFSSHILSEVQSVTDRVAAIRRGKVVETAATQKLLERAVHRIEVHFQEAVESAEFERVPGVTVLQNQEDREFRLRVAGNMDPVIKFCARHVVTEFKTLDPTLAEVFLNYYSPPSSPASATSSTEATSSGGPTSNP